MLKRFALFVANFLGLIAFEERIPSGDVPFVVKALDGLSGENVGKCFEFATSSPLLGFQQRIQKPTTCLIGFNAKPRYAAQLAMRVQEQVLDRVGSQQRTVERAGDTQAMQR